MSAQETILAERRSKPQGSSAPFRGGSLRDRLFRTRALSGELARPLSDEDQVVQANDDASPTKWHLAHTTWFFEAFVLKRFLAGYRLFDERFAYCFNSYYESVGPRHPSAQTRAADAALGRSRARLSRPCGRGAALLCAGSVSRGSAGADRDRHQSRAAASGADAHRHP